jgi:hypothetical protein
MTRLFAIVLATAALCWAPVSQAISGHHHRGCCCAQPAPACGCGCGSSVAPSAAPAHAPAPAPAPAPPPAAMEPIENAPAGQTAQSPNQTYQSFSAEQGASSAAPALQPIPAVQPAPAPYVSGNATLSNDSTQNNPTGVSQTAPVTGFSGGASSVGSTQNNPSGTSNGGFYYGGGNSAPLSGTAGRPY